jgi:hypothetical protein
MSETLSYSDPTTLAKAVGELIQQALADGVHPADISSTLTVAAVRLGLQFAPNAGVAFAVVMKAASDVAADWAGAPECGGEQEISAAPAGTTMH